MQDLHGFQKSMERPLDPMQHTTPCSEAEGQSRTSRWKTYSRYLDHGTIFPELYIMGVVGGVTLPIHRADRDYIKYSTSS